MDLFKRNGKCYLQINDQYLEDIKFYIVKIINVFNIKPKKLQDIYEGLFEYFDVDNIKDFEKQISKPMSLTHNKLVDENIENFSKIIPIDSDEKEILRFLAFVEANDVLQDVLEVLGNLNVYQVLYVLSELFNINMAKTENILQNSNLVKANIIEVMYIETRCFYNKVTLFRRSFAEKLLYTKFETDEIFKEYFQQITDSELKLKDYKYIKDIKNIFNYLQTVNCGVNILFYGKPGTGKTELAKTLAKAVNKKIYSVSCIDTDNIPLKIYERLRAYKIAQFVLDDNSLLLYDEAEDIFNSEQRREYKPWINSSLENNRVPTIWITNDIYSMDEAFIRRFDYVLEMKTPSKKQRRKIISQYLDLSNKTLKLLSSNRHLTPAIIQRSAKVWKKCSNDEKELIRIINNTLNAQGYEIIKKSNKKKPIKSIALPEIYNLEYINTDINIANLVDNLKNIQSVRIFIYGKPGTGKSAFGQYIAKTLNKEIILKKGSDLLSKYVGETEQNIAAAFKEAKEKNAVLIFDEIDSFLLDRQNASNSWEITQVNELLTQMENFEGIFIATTNLKEIVDKASLRRFDIKMEFKPLHKEQLKNLFINICNEMKIKPHVTCIKKILELDNLTFGDFMSVVRRSKFYKINSCINLIEELKNEIEIKTNSNKKIGLL